MKVLSALLLVVVSFACAILLDHWRDAEFFGQLNSEKEAGCVYADATKIATVAGVKGSTSVEVWYCGPSTSNHSASYYEDKNGVLCSDGEVWDNCILVGPKVQGERIYIPESLLCENDKAASKCHWFYRDTCSRIEVPVYALRDEGKGSYQAYSYDPKEGELTRTIRKEEPREYDRQFYVIGPKMEGGKVILENYSGDGRTYYIPRSEMIWVNPPVDPTE